MRVRIALELRLDFEPGTQPLTRGTSRNHGATQAKIQLEVGWEC